MMATLNAVCRAGEGFTAEMCLDPSAMDSQNLVLDVLDGETVFYLFIFFAVHFKIFTKKLLSRL